MTVERRVPHRWLDRTRPIASITVAAAILCLLGCRESSSEVGYCEALQRRLSDEELIQIAIRRQFNANRMKIDGSEESIRDFYKNNPDCCRVDRNVPRTALEKSRDFFVFDVEVNFEVKDARKAAIGPYYEGHVLIRPCGEIDSVYGTSTDVLKKSAN